MPDKASLKTAASAPSRRIEVVEDARYQSHQGPDGHPERPERLVAIGQAIDAFRDRVDVVTPRPATRDEILRVHQAGMIDTLAATETQSPGHLDADTYFSPSSFEVAQLAAGGTVEVARRIMAGEVDAGLAAIRPPGHHAEASRSMGFCLFNNVAIAVRALQVEFDTPRILLFDWDVHHGNGTQHTFEDDPNVLYISTHQFPFYPGTGDVHEQGEGPGLGTTLNIPMPAGCGDMEYIGVVERLVVPAALHFRPDLILISCGFDAHRDDPLASMDVSLSGYRAMARVMDRLADMLCGGRILYVLEGGYALSGVREGASAVLGSLLRETPAAEPDPATDSPLTSATLEPGTILHGLVDRVAQVHGSRIPDLGAR